ncbi:hypothetical protein ACHAPE_001427 [Trichoderma viride]
MSQPKSTKGSVVVNHFWKPCALLIDDEVLGGAGLGLDTYITTTIQVHRDANGTSWAGFSISFPFGKTNEDDGFGVCHSVDTRIGAMPPADSYRLEIKFPKFEFTVEPADGSLRKLVPATDKKLSSLVIRLEDFPEVNGLGMPFANPGHLSEGVISKGECIKGDITLIDMIRRMEFHFIVAVHDNALRMNLDAELPAPFRYPYGEEHFWDEARYDEMLPKTKGGQFKRAWSFDNDNEHLSALTQSQVQDVMWLHKASQEIAETKFRAYFINPQNCPPAEASLFYAIVPLHNEFLAAYEDAWRALTKSGFLTLRLHDDKIDKEPAKWEARIQEASKTLDILQNHPVDRSDLVLHVRRPKQHQHARDPDFEVKVYEQRRLANIALQNGKDNWTCVTIEFEDILKDYIRKVDAVNKFAPGAKPTNPIACGISKDAINKAAQANERLPIPPTLQFKMSLHRDLLRGKGFSKTLISGTINAAEDADEALAQLGELKLNEAEVTPPLEKIQLASRLPMVNVIDVDENLRVALLEFVLEKDRPRFLVYFGKLHLGIAVISAPPGFGKTTAVAVATLFMQATVKKVYATAPTNVAADNFAERLDSIGQHVAVLRNRGKSAKDKMRARSPLVLRGYIPLEEVDAFLNCLRDHELGDKTGPNNNWRRDSKWKLNLSASFWLLMVLEYPAVRRLGPNDPQALHDMRDKFESLRVYDRFRAVATGNMTWDEYQKSDPVPQSTIVKMFDNILEIADIVCTTPAVSCQRPFVWWKEQKARGITVDEAGAMNRPDLLSVWGNTLTPIILSGDDNQLPPTVTTENIKDSEGNFLNRLAPEGKISPLEFFKATGWPVYRLRVQLRMGNGLFDMCHEQVYSDLPFKYGPKSSIANHKIGVTLETYLKTKFPELRPARAGALREVFIHCPDTVCLIDPVTKSKRNQEQVNRALKFLSELVKNTDIPASSIGVISPYKANVELFERCRKDSQHSAPLSGMPAAATVDSFQGREADIMVVILGTTEQVGPGFTVDKNRLNVMFSRQKSGLLVFGDMGVMSRVEEKKAPPKASTRGRGRGGGRGGGQGGDRGLTFTMDGVTHFVNRGMLDRVLQSWSDTGRIVNLE